MPANSKQVSKELLFVMREIFFGHDGGATFLDDRAPALLAMLEELTAEEASRPVAGYCLAAHARHVCFSLEAYQRAVESGEMSHIVDNWPDWADFSVTAREWRDLLDGLGDGLNHFERWLLSESSFPPLPAISMRLLLGALAHNGLPLGRGAGEIR